MHTDILKDFTFVFMQGQNQEKPDPKTGTFSQWWMITLSLSFGAVRILGLNDSVLSSSGFMRVPLYSHNRQIRIVFDRHCEQSALDRVSSVQVS